jgi:hypothetical protein
VADEVGDGVVRDDAVGVDADVDLFAVCSRAKLSASALPPLGLVRTVTRPEAISAGVGFAMAIL